MDRIWQWAWERYGPRYSWVICAVFFASILSVSLLLSFVVVAFEKSSHYVEAAAVTGVAVAVLAYVVILPDSRRFHRAQRWAAGDEVDRAAASKRHVHLPVDTSDANGPCSRASRSRPCRSAPKVPLRSIRCRFNKPLK